MLRRLNKRRLVACDSFESDEEENEDDDDGTEYEDNSDEDAMTIFMIFYSNESQNRIHSLSCIQYV
jgi:hypothetical protein